MKTYEKPMIIKVEDVAESVYMAIGSSSETPKKAGCDSKYMKGVYKEQNYNDVNGADESKKTAYYVLGCTGCPAMRWNGCALQVDEAYLQGAESYGVDNGNRMPDWERKGFSKDALWHTCQ